MNRVFHFMAPASKSTNRFPVKVNCLLGILILGFVCACDKTPATPKYNVVLISIDTLRAGHLSCYGYFRNTSPAIDEFAKNAIIFKNAFSQSAFTLSSHMSMLTSTYPPVHGLMNAKEYIPLSKSIKTLPEMLKEHNYKTFGFYDFDILMDPKYGFARGFDLYAPKDNSKVLSTIADQGKGPFFLFVHYYDVHLSTVKNKDSEYYYDGPPEFRDKFIDPSLGPAPRTGQTNLNKLSENEMKQLLSQYDGGILHVDSQLRDLFNSLKDKDLYDNSLIILTSDHGEGLGFKGDMTLHGWLFDVGTHVPLIIKFPKDYVPPVHLPHEVTSQVRSVDIMPTILDVLSIEPPPYVNGESLLKTDGDRINFACQGNGFSVRTKDSKILIYTKDGQYSYMKKGNVELYDMNKDPEESNNIYGRGETRSEELDRLAQQMEKDAKALNSKLADRGAQKGTLDEASVERLKGLGYLQ